MRVVLISTYDLGRQPFGLASPAAWLREARVEVACIDVSRTRIDDDQFSASDVAGFYLPMHTATRLALPLITRARRANRALRICAFGLYAPLNEAALRAAGVDAVFGGEFEQALTDWILDKAKGLELTLPRPKAEGTGTDAAKDKGQRTKDENGETGDKAEGRELTLTRPKAEGTGTDAAKDKGQRTKDKSEETQDKAEGRELTLTKPKGEIARLQFKVPDRRGLPALNRYAALQVGDGTRRIVGYTEASRGCKHLCRHCPIVPVYDGRFRVVSPQVVIDDIRAQVAAGARHITFGDPDFFNGIGHARAVVEAFARECPDITYDVTIKIEHLLKHQDALPLLVSTGCLFVTSAVESVDDAVLAKLRKGHTRADFERVVARCREVGLALTPTFLPFTPWTKLESYLELLSTIAALDLVDQVAPIQLAIRLLIPNHSRLLELDEIRRAIGPFDPQTLVYPWTNTDGSVDALQQEVEQLVGTRINAPRHEVFGRVWEAAHRATGRPSTAPVLPSRATIPFLTEPWYC